MYKIQMVYYIIIIFSHDHFFSVIGQNKHIKDDVSKPLYAITPKAYVVVLVIAYNVVTSDLLGRDRSVFLWDT